MSSSLLVIATLYHPGTMVEIKKEMNNYLCVLNFSVQKILCSGGITITDTSLTYLSWQAIPAISVPSERAFSVAG